MIVDDDALSREVMAVLAAEAGFEVDVHETADSALDALAGGEGCRPDVILADMQMPGLCGEPFAKLLRAACGTETVLLAMSGTSVPCEIIRSFDAFVLKPFSMNEIWTALDRSHNPESNRPGPPCPQPVLNMTTYASLAELMPGDQLKELYTMCLNDMDTRIHTLRHASLTRDIDAWTRAAHSIKGSCGMVGAIELAALGAGMEHAGLPAIDNIAPFEEFLAASSRLRLILEAQN